jgi:hypothetical protein
MRLRACLVGLLLWLSLLISQKPNQTSILSNALLAKAEQKPASRAKHAETCFSGFGCVRVYLFMFLPLTLIEFYPRSATEWITCTAPFPNSPLYSNSLPRVRVGRHRRCLRVRRRVPRPVAGEFPDWSPTSLPLRCSRLCPCPCSRLLRAPSTLLSL